MFLHIAFIDIADLQHSYHRITEYSELETTLKDQV